MPACTVIVHKVLSCVISSNNVTCLKSIPAIKVNTSMSTFSQCRCMPVCTYCMHGAVYVSRFEKRGEFALNVNFGLVVLGGNTVDELSVALCYVSVAAPIPEIHSLNVQNTLGTIMRKWRITLLEVLYICQHGNGTFILPDLRCRKELWVSNLDRMLDYTTGTYDAISQIYRKHHLIACFRQ